MGLNEFCRYWIVRCFISALSSDRLFSSMSGLMSGLTTICRSIVSERNLGLSCIGRENSYGPNSWLCVLISIPEIGSLNAALVSFTVI